MENVRIIKKKIPADLLQYFQVKKQNRWILRNSIIWHKRNCMPSSASDRFTVDYETIAFFTKQGKYWFEQQFEPSGTVGSKHVAKKGDKGSEIKNTVNATYFDRDYTTKENRNMRCVWDITTQPFKEAHFAVFPEELPSRCIKAGCPKEVCPKCGKAREKIIESEYVGASVKRGGHLEGDGNGSQGNVYNVPKEAAKREIKGYTNCGCNAGFEPGVVLDPFMGSGTTAVVAKKLGRQWLGIELNEKYIEMANRRIENTVVNGVMDL